MQPAPRDIPPHLIIPFDIFADERLMPDPQAGYVKLVGKTPDVFYTPLNGGHWVVTRYETANDVLSDPQVFSSRNMQIPATDTPAVMLPLTLDPPQHTPYRRILMQLFSAKAMNALEGHIRESAIRLIENASDAGECDFVASISGVLPVAVFMQLMGLPLERLTEFRGWVDDSFAASDTQQRNDIYGRIMRFMNEVIEARAKEPQHDLVSRLLSSKIEERYLSCEEVGGISLLLFIAGMDTVANALSFGVRHIAQDSALQREVAADTSLIPTMVEEILRRYGFTATQRIVTKDVILEGAPLKAGDMVFVSFATANVDDHFGVTARQFELRRGNADQHLTFGGGPHRCVGRYLARLEMRVLYEEMFKRWRNIELAGVKDPNIRAGNVMAMDRLAIRFERVDGDRSGP